MGHVSCTDRSAPSRRYSHGIVLFETCVARNRLCHADDEREGFSLAQKVRNFSSVAYGANPMFCLDGGCENYYHRTMVGRDGPVAPPWIRG